LITGDACSAVFERVGLNRIRENAMAATLSLPHADVDLGQLRFDLTLRNITVNTEWIEGTLEVRAEALGQKINEDIPFKTRNGVSESVELPLGAKLTMNIYLENPKRICADAELKWGPAKVPASECMNI
jgi:hypothetical protein